MSEHSSLHAAQQHADAQETAGDLTGARLTLEDALNIGRAQLGEDDPAVLTVAYQLAGVLQRSDAFPAARRVLEEAFAAGQRQFGDADPLMLGISFDLGVVAQELSNRHEARRAFGRVAAHGPHVLGDDHWAVTQARAYLGEEPPTVRLTLDRPAMEMIRNTVEAPVQPVEPQPERSQHLESPPTFGPDTGRRSLDTGQHNSDGRPLGRNDHWVETPWQERGSAQRGGVVAVDDGRAAYPRGRGPAVFAAIAAALAAVIAVVALVVVLAGRGSDDDAGDGPALGGRPPTDVRLRDSGSTVEVSWQDPADGTVSFVVMGGRADEQLKAMGRLGPAQTRLGLNGLNARLDYCFAVVAVYGTSQFATSSQVCTSRSAIPLVPTTSG